MNPVQVRQIRQKVETAGAQAAGLASGGASSGNPADDFRRLARAVSDLADAVADLTKEIQDRA